MKVVSYPPFVVFFDTIAVFMFLLIMNQDRQITVELPQKLFTGAHIIYESGKHYYDLSGYEYRPKRDENFVFFLDCEKRFFECREIMSRHGEKAYIVLPSHLYDDIAKITFIAFKDKLCTHARFVISEQGNLDYEKIEKYNKCFSKMPGFSNRVEALRFSKN